MAKKLFLIFLFLLPLQTVYLLREPFIGGVKWEYGVAGVYFVDVLLLVFVVSFLMETFFFKKYQISNIKYQISDVILLSFLLWAGVSIFWAPDVALAGYFIVKLLLATGLFFVVRSIEIDMKKVVFVLLAAGVLQGGIGIAQFLSQQSISSSIFGMSAHEASQAGSSVLKIDSGRFLRAYGTFPHPNVFGGFLGVILVVGISYYTFRPSFRRRGQGEVGDHIQNLSSILLLERGGGIMLAGSIIIFLGLILTFSRAAWLGAVMGMVAIAIYIHFSSVIREQRSRFRVTFFKMLGVLGMAGAVFVGILHEQIFPRFDTATIEREGSVTERIVSLRDAQKIIAGHPLIGVGAGNFTAAIIEKGEMGLMGERGDETVKNEKGERGLMGETGRPVWSIQPAHNVFVLILAELGIVGFVLFVIFLGNILYSFFPPLPAYRTGRLSKEGVEGGSGYLGSESKPLLNPPLRKGRRKENMIFAIALLTLVPALLLDHFLWSSHFGLLFFFLLLGLVTRK